MFDDYMDIDKDGFVVLDEFRHFIHNLDGLTDDEKKEPAVKMLFKLLDRNKD